jgi:putative transposase
MGFVRKKNRLADKKLYEGNNGYFVTICTFERQYLFGDNNCVLNQYGEIVQKVWLDLPSLFENIVLDEFVIMPNHIHFVIVFVGISKRKSNQELVNLSEIVRTFKAKSTYLIAKIIVELCNTMADKSCLYENKPNCSGCIYAPQKDVPIWQKSFYDHIIRNEQDLARIREYIQNNPKNWQEDILNQDNKNKYDAWVKRNDQNK